MHQIPKSLNKTYYCGGTLGDSFIVGCKLLKVYPANNQKILLKRFTSHPELNKTIDEMFEILFPFIKHIPIATKNKKEELKCKGIKLLYPYKKNSKKVNSNKDKKLLKRRHIVENSICSLKQFRKLNTRYERKLKYFDGFVKLGVILLLLR